jgi:hypothetical protein
VDLSLGFLTGVHGLSVGQVGKETSTNVLYYSDVCSFDRVRENTVLGELEWEWADTVMERFDPYEFELTREAEILRGFYQAELQRVAEAAMTWRRRDPRLREGSEPIWEDLSVEGCQGE